MGNEVVGNSFYDGIENPMDAIEKMGNWMVRSGLFGMDREEQGKVMAMACLCERKNPIEIARQFHIVEGKLSKKYETMIAEFYQLGGKIDWVQRDGDACEAKFIHPENGEFTLRITMEELTSSGVATTSKGEVKANYLRYPRQMLTARVVSEAMRIIAPGIVCGVYTPEEISDFDNHAPKPLLQEKPKAKNKAKAKEPKEVDAKVVDEEPEAKEDAPTTKKEASTKTPDTPTKKVDDEAKEVNDLYHPDTIAKLEEVADSANAYLKSIGWINEGQTYMDVERSKAAQISGHLSSFIDKAKEVGNG